MTTLFISDLHLDQSRPATVSAFLTFLTEKTNNATALYILGDFFEVWLGDDHESAFNKKIIDAVSAVKIPVYIMHGNRDFLLGDTFSKQSGAVLLDDPCQVEINGESVLLMHGDSLCTRDEEYMKTRLILRNEAFQSDFLSKSIEERQAFANSLRSRSNEHVQETADDIMDVTPAEVVKIMQQFDVTRMIHGHTHRPQIHSLDMNGREAERIVLGDWSELGWYLICDENGFQLKSFEIATT